MIFVRRQVALSSRARARVRLVRVAFTSPDFHRVDVTSRARTVFPLCVVRALFGRREASKYLSLSARLPNGSYEKERES